MDLNCRRGDSERFLEEVLAGIARSAAREAEVVVKLHPADRPGVYAHVLERHPGVSVVASGDVVDLLDGFDVYVTTYSTSLLQAGMVGVNIGVAAPVAFFPFSGWKDSFLGDLHAHGGDAVDFYTRKKTITSRWFSSGQGSGAYFVES